MEAATLGEQARWTFAQWAVVILASVQLLWALAGLFAEPSFSFGDDAPTKQVLGVDFNGVHALSGLLLFGPALIFARQPRWAVFYALYAAAALIATGVWALLDTQPAYVFPFPNNTSDGIFHLVTGFLFLDIAVMQLVLDRAGRAGPS
jgi:hypothetical protein